MAIPLWIREKLFQKSLLRKELREFGSKFDSEKCLLFAEHHQSHSASAFFPVSVRRSRDSNNRRSWRVGNHIGRCRRGSALEMLKEIHFPHSLGLLYSAFTYYTGFKVNSGEYKLMGLAPYGEPRFSQRILDHLIDLKSTDRFGSISPTSITAPA